MSSQDLQSVIASELKLAPVQVEGALALFDEGNTLPFIARYRKEATGGLDEIQLRDVRDRAQYLRELGDRRADQTGARRSLPALQAEAPHTRHDRARARARAARRAAVERREVRRRSL